MKLKRTILCLSGLLAVLVGRISAQEAGIEVNTLGFAGWKATVGVEPLPGLLWGGFFQGSALMQVQKDFDTGELGAWIRAGRQPQEGHPMGWEAEAQAGWRFQTQSLGAFQSLFSRTRLLAGALVGPVLLGADLGWDQTWVTSGTWGERVSDTCRDLYSGMASPGSGGVWGPSASQLRTGLGTLWTISPSWGFNFRSGAVWTPGSLVSGFDGMMFGAFPFYMDLGIRWRWK